MLLYSLLLRNDSKLVEKERDPIVSLFYMAISETMSSPSDWAQLFQHNLSGHQVAPSARNHTSTTTFGDRPSEATVVTTTVTSASIPSPSASPHLNPEGRVSKPIRRRSRASKRTPTTLLNTDTSNFRAMVQQFTGCPSTPFAAASHPGTAATNFNFGLGNSRQQMVNPAAVMVPSPSGYHLQFQQQQQHQYHQQPHQYIYSMGNPRPNMNVSDHGFLMEGISSRVPPRPPSSNDNIDNSNNYMF